MPVLLFRSFGPGVGVVAVSASAHATGGTWREEVE